MPIISARGIIAPVTYWRASHVLDGWASGLGSGGTTNNQHPWRPRITQTNTFLCFMFSMEIIARPHRLFTSSHPTRHAEKFHTATSQFAFLCQSSKRTAHELCDKGPFAKVKEKCPPTLRIRKWKSPQWGLANLSTKCPPPPFPLHHFICRRPHTQATVP